ncbi:DUF221-domain-containing protein [Sporormia fimetaria CBS 119925]|uniref:DUF221-domain-containing protein n=1 Tax=Sporormia fimetaria CBS 119925 TaxID=1340428 RepID=A0A6A6V010_9PLEO|nr:DUF221-domain-containing protein [Sporormia fimetaria CBS 119925]
MDFAMGLVRRQDAGDPGSARDKPESNSASSLVSTLVPNLLIAAALVTLFMIFRPRFKRLYAPRTYINSLGEHRYTPPPSTGFLGWIKDFRRISDKWILDHSSIDGYLFVRYFKLMVVISILGCLITWPVLFPINITGGGGNTQLDLLSMSNVANPLRYYAHALVSCVFMGLVMLIIARESFYAVNLRQAYRRSPFGASRLSSRVILFTGVPATMGQADLFQMFPGARHAWVASNVKELEKLVEDRDDTALKLEAAEIELSRNANANRLKVAKGKKAYQGPEEDGAKWLDPKKRPTHKLKFLIGKKVDTIQYGRQHLAELIPKIQAEQDKHWKGDGKVIPAVFVEFATQRQAQDAWQKMQDRKTKPKMKLVARQFGVHPDEVVWSNLRISMPEHWIRYLIATAIITVLIIFFAVPVAFVGVVSQINYLTERFPWLEWINKIPGVILGVITGLLPVVMLAILMALVPIFFRFLAKMSGHVTRSQIELQTQSWYFAFQVIQVFLITTMTSAATTVVDQVLEDPGMVITLLSENLPKASNFYINYFILFGLSAFAGTLLNIGGFVTVVLLGRILPGKTPRKIFQKLTKLAAPLWGSEFPKWVNLGVIALSYSCIAPLVLGFSTIGLFLIYLAFRYNYLYAYEPAVDTRGAAYQKALQQLTTGVYLAEICLIGLFAIESADNRHAIGPLAIECVLLAITVLFHLTMRRALAHHEARIAYADPVPDPNTQEKGTVDGAGMPVSRTENRSDVTPPRPSRLPAFLRRIIDPETNSVSSLSLSLEGFYHKPQDPLPQDVVASAYFNPAITSQTPTIWLVHDEMGISEREVRDTQRAVPGLRITDEQAFFNAKNKVEWPLGVEEGKAREAPVFEEHYAY